MDEDWDARELRGERDRQVAEEVDLSDAPQPKMGFEGKTAAVQASVGEDLWEVHSAGGKIGEFTAGRGWEDFAESEMLRAVVRSMLEVMAGGLGRVMVAAPELGARLGGDVVMGLGAAGDKEVWRFVRDGLGELMVRVRTELEAWHEG